MFKWKKVISLSLLMVMLISTVTTVHALSPSMESSIEHLADEEIQPKAIRCGYCDIGYMRDGTSVDNQTIKRYGGHTKVNGSKCNMNANHNEYLTYRTSYSTCDYCSRGIEYGTTILSSCRVTR